MTCCTTYYSWMESLGFVLVYIIYIAVVVSSPYIRRDKAAVVSGQPDYERISEKSFAVGDNDNEKLESDEVAAVIRENLLLIALISRDSVPAYYHVTTSLTFCTILLNIALILQNV